MTTDRELLEAAAKAAGIELESVVEDGTDAGKGVTRLGYWWAPLHDDGDALRLAVKLRLEVNIRSDFVEVSDQRGNVALSIDVENDPYAATRRAIVRAAAEIGRNMT
jgi:hypothetical protein